VTTRKTSAETDEQRSATRKEADEGNATPQEQVGAPSDKLSHGAPASAGNAPEARDPATLVAEAEAKRDEYLELAQRVQADFENYRKRAAREQERLVAHAHERLVKELLPVLDDLERALEAAERHEEAKLVDGVRLVERSLRSALVKEGLREIETDGAFDPHVHEALLTQAREDAEPGSVVDVVQRGYRIGDKVIRPARVVVAE
jgi:molecular chaperone GrpE